MIPIDEIAQLVPCKNMFTTSQINKLAEAIRTGSQFIIKPTKGSLVHCLQVGTLFASINVPLLLKELTSNGLQGYSRNQPLPPLPPPKSDGIDMEVRAYNESLVPYRPPPSRSRWSKGGEVNPEAPPPFIVSWPNYAGTIGASSNKSKIKKTIKEKGLLLSKTSSFN